MNILKRSMAMFLVLCMLVGMVPMTAFADETDSTDPGVTESIEENEEFEKAAEETTEAIEETTETTEETTETTEETTETTEETTETTEETTETTEKTMETTEETTEVTEETTEITEEITEVTEETTKAAKRAKKVASAEVFVEPERKISNYSFEATDFMKVFHLDCGRKYFTVDQVKELIDAISNVGFSHMELAIGNDGLRLLLDDMSVEANGTTYSSDTVKSGIKSGNAAYSHAGEWSETEMNEIISYAKSKGIEIIPLVNNPGHMDSILAAMKACGIDGYYKSSTRTVDLENDEAVSFTQALVMKYANYFSSKGCNYFNIGADEYANDYHTSDSTGMGFGYLIDNNKYGNFIAYVNTLVDDICDLGMTPIAFNDGIYFRENTSFGTFDTRLVIAAWTGGWGGIKPASTTFLQNKGHRILNTNERWYYVLGRKQSSNSTYCYESALSNAKSESITTVTDHKTGVNPVGAMQCVWCDVPSVNYETYKSNVMTLINTLAENNSDYFTGPNVVEPEEPEVPETVTMTDDKTNISVSAPGLTEVTIAEVKDDAQLPEIEGAGEVKVYDVSPMVGDEAYTGEATIAIPVPENWTKVRGGVLASEHGEEVLGIEGKLENGMFTFTVPHFSNVVTYAVDADKVIELEVGDSHKFEVEGKDLSGNTYTPNPAGVAKVDVTYEQVPGEDIVTLGDRIDPQNENGWSDTGVIRSGDAYLTMNNNGTLGYTDNINEATVFKVTRFRDNRWTISNGNNYLLYDSSAVSGSSSSYGWRYNDGFYCNSYSSYSSYYLTYSDGEWSVQRSASNKSYLYDISTSTTIPVNQSTVTFTALAAGETYVTVDGVTYKIVVNKKTESATLSIGDNITYTDNSKNVPVVENSTVATATINNGVLTITAKAEGITKVITDNGEYTIKVIPFNPDTVSKVPVFLWITSHPIDADGISSLEISAGNSNVYSAEGAKLTDLIPFAGKDPQNETNADTICNLWQVRLQHEGAQQTSEGSDDKTAVGEQVEYIRYYAGKWQVKDTSGTWLDVAATDQLTAYYLQKSPLTDEVDSLVKDWGFQFKDGQKYWQYFDESNYAALSAQVIYEDGSMNPDTKANNSDEPLIDTTVFFNFWAKEQDGHTAARDIGYFLPQFNDHYEIYKITTMHGECSVTARSDTATAASVNYGNPDPNDEDEVIVWQVGDGTPELIGKDGNDALQWRRHKDAILIRIYLRAKVTEDSLNVIYYDEKFGDELYSYNISVDAGVNFTKDILPVPEAFKENSERIDVTNCTIKNKNGVTQYLQTDLTKVPEAKGKYDSALYTYTGSKISEDGKTLYLYYNINTNVLKPNFVVDFGLPFTFSLGDVTTSPELVDKVTVSARYGSVDYNSTAKTFTYTPTKILQNIDVLSINIQFAGEDTAATTNVGVTPATTVHYEESFINWDANWSGGNAAITVGNQTTEVLGDKEHIFGYDPIYNPTGASNSTHATASTIGAKGTFTFTGDGIQVFANCTEISGYVAVQVTNSAGKIVNLSMVDTVVKGGTTDATTGQEGNMFGLPIVSLVDLQNMEHDKYTVKITKIMDGKQVHIDGIRVFNTVKDSKIFTTDEEDNPQFYELRDMVLNALVMEHDVAESEQYGSLSNMANQVYNAITADEEQPVAVLLNSAYNYYNDVNADGKIDEDEIKKRKEAAQNKVQDLLDNGPKNELFLYRDQTLVFNVTTSRIMQLGLKAPTGETSYSITVNGNANANEEKSLTASVDMFYALNSTPNEAPTKYTVTVTNTGDEILSVTLLKICDDPNAYFNSLTAKDMEYALIAMGYDFPDDSTDTKDESQTDTTAPSTDKKAESSNSKDSSSDKKEEVVNVPESTGTPYNKEEAVVKPETTKATETTPNEEATKAPIIDEVAKVEDSIEKDVEVEVEETETSIPEVEVEADSQNPIGLIIGAALTVAAAAVAFILGFKKKSKKK